MKGVRFSHKGLAELAGKKSTVTSEVRKGNIHYMTGIVEGKQFEGIVKFFGRESKNPKYSMRLPLKTVYVVGDVYYAANENGKKQYPSKDGHGVFLVRLEKIEETGYTNHFGDCVLWLLSWKVVK